MRVTLVLALLFAAPAFAQEVPDTLALNDEDAKTCQAKACRTITDAAYQMIAERLERLERENAELAAKAQKKPIRTYCI